jgi:hypothetical protein
MATVGKREPIPKAAPTASRDGGTALPHLSTILSQLNPAAYQSIADQLRRGATSVSVGGKSYSITNPAWASQIQKQYPAAAPPPASTTTAPAAPTYFGAGATAAPPESVALSQMAQIDPYSEAARQALARSIAEPGAGAADMLTLYGQVDPTSLAMRQALGGQVGGDLALGATLDPTTQMQIAQSSRAAQGARGNVYGVGPAVEEALTQGQAGLALRAQRQQAAQSYLQSGVDPGTVALNLLRNQQAATQSYLGSGQTPYQAGAGYLAAAQQAGQAASAGGPVYQPASLGSPYSYLNPTYGLQTAQNTTGMYNQLLNAYGMQQAGVGPNRLLGAGVGALGGAASGALMGAAAGGVGAIPGAILGGVMGGAKGYFG